MNSLSIVNWLIGRGVTSMPCAAFECGVLGAGRRRVLDQLPFPAGTGWGEMPWRAASSATVALSREASSATFTLNAASNFRLDFVIIRSRAGRPVPTLS
jgi:hypothetical protein